MDAECREYSRQAKWTIVFDKHTVNGRNLQLHFVRSPILDICLMIEDLCKRLLQSKRRDPKKTASIRTNNFLRAASFLPIKEIGDNNKCNKDCFIELNTPYVDRH